MDPSRTNFDNLPAAVSLDYSQLSETRFSDLKDKLAKDSEYSLKFRAQLIKGYETGHPSFSTLQKFQNTMSKVKTIKNKHNLKLFIGRTRNGNFKIVKGKVAAWFAKVFGGVSFNKLTDNKKGLTDMIKSWKLSMDTANDVIKNVEFTGQDQPGIDNYIHEIKEFQEGVDALLDQIEDPSLNKIEIRLQIADTLAEAEKIIPEYEDEF